MIQQGGEGRREYMLAIITCNPKVVQHGLRRGESRKRRFASAFDKYTLSASAFTRLK
jgi:hypothetical protein